MVQRRTDEVGERRGRRERNFVKPSLPVKPECATDRIEIPNKTLHPAVLQAAYPLGVTPAHEPAPRPHQQVMRKGSQ